MVGEIDYSFEKYKIYTRDDCPWCVKAKEFMDDNLMEYEEIDLSNFAERQRWYDANGFRDDQRTVPKLYDTKGVLIGGYTDLVDHVEAE